MTMVKDIQSMHTKLAVIATDVKYIKKVIDGNGEPGLLSDTRKNSDFRVASEAKTKTLQFLFGSGWLIAIMFIVLNIIGII